MFSIRPAGEDDIELVRELCYKTWPQTYAGILSASQIDYMLGKMYSVPALRTQMSDGSKFVIVYLEQEPIGFAAYFPASATTFKLDKIYIVPGNQRSGAGAFAVAAIINEVRRMGARALTLQVNRQNKAKKFYEKLGFVETGEFDFDIGNGYFMNDYVMEKRW